MVDDDDWGQLWIRPPEPSRTILPAEPSGSKLGGSGPRKWRTLCTKYSIHTRRVLLHATKSYDMGHPALLPLRRKA
jgi:hypothetical protein